MLSHRRGWSLAVLLGLFPLVLFAASTNDPPLATYRTGTSEVRISFYATDENNRLVQALGKDDFAVVDSEAVIRDFRTFQRSNETALDVVLLVDASASVAPRFRATINNVLRLVSQAAVEPGTEITAIAFSGAHTEVLCRGDCGRSTAEEKILAVKAGGTTPLFDALSYTADLAASRHAPGMRQVILLFSDGHDTISLRSAHDALAAVVGSGALLYAVSLDPSASEGNAFLQQIAEATGGRSFPVRDASPDILRAILEDQRASYILTYQLPSHVPGFHSLRVLPKHNLKLRFHCPRGYNYDEIR
jgi:VWFA-related protein